MRRRWGVAGDRRRDAIGGLALGALLLGALPTAGSVIVKMPGGGSAARVAEALARAMNPGGARVVELTGDRPADGARLAREARDEPVLYTIGPDATEAAGETGPPVVSLLVPNPARVPTPGVYVSIYPRLENVVEFLKGPLAAKRAGLLFTPAKNREIALAFLKAAEGSGLTVVPLPVATPGDLVRELKQGLSKIDVLLLTVDPIVFDPKSLEFVTSEAREAGKPSVGFLEELTELGVTISLVAPAEAAAAAALEAARDPVKVGKKRIEVDRPLVVVSRRGAAGLGLEPEALGADRLR